MTVTRVASIRPFDPGKGLLVVVAIAALAFHHHKSRVKDFCEKKYTKSQ
jgi:hypothetical protein